MSPISRVTLVGRGSFGLLTLSLLATSLLAQPSESHVAPAILSQGQNLGQESPSTSLMLTAWLRLHNRPELDARVEQLYTPGSATFHKWLTNADLKAYAPTAAEIETVKRELAANHLTITSIDPLNLSVRFSGKTSDVESAFRTQINRYTVQGKVVRASSSRPTLSGAAGALLSHISGINSMPATPYLARAINPATKKAFAGVPLAKAKTMAKASPDGLVYSGNCFSKPATVTLTGVSFKDFTTPVTDVVSGLVFGGNSMTGANGEYIACGYSPSEVQGFYGLEAAYSLGYTGTGQTIVLIDAYLEPTALSDSNAFNQMYGLPMFTSSNYTEYNPQGAVIPGSKENWADETDLDLQWAHAMAPGAKIALVQTYSNEESDLQGGALYAITNHLGDVISLSFGTPEYFEGPFDADNWNQIAELGASKGIALNVATGDSGDFTIGGYEPVPDVSVPADSPYVTAVGGTTIGISPIDGKPYTTGWGNNLNEISIYAGLELDPPVDGYFVGGGGGGSSSFFAKPAYQSSLAGSGRQLPDVSALADDYTGVEFVYTSTFDGNQYVGVIGGTSLASPIFSGIWALVNDYSGRSVGQAAPYIAAFAHTPFMEDVLPITGPANVTVSETEAGVTTKFSSIDLSQPLDNTTQYVSALWDDTGNGQYGTITFGTDSSLTVTQGWDNVTGYGTPNIGAGLAAIGAAAKKQQ